jgi:hypothetical protein
MLNNIKICGWCGELETHGNNKRHKDGLANGCKKCRSAAQTKYWNEGAGKKLSKQRRDNAKLDAFKAYGGCQCSGCGENEMVVLSIDHINGGGGKHREEIKNRYMNIYFWLRANKYPEGFRVLCMNCQFRAKVGALLPKDAK